LFKDANSFNITRRELDDLAMLYKQVKINGSA